VASLYNNLGATYARAGRPDEAIAVLSKALTIYDEAYGRIHIETARAYQNRGVAWSWKREEDKALADFERARDIKLALLGPNDPLLAGVESNLADLALDLGDPERARRHAQDALRVLVPLLGTEHPQTVYPHVSLADALLALGDLEGARAEIDVALRIADTNELDPFEHARLQFAAARVLWEEGTDRAQARTLANDALVGYQSPERHSAPEIDEIRAWLRKHP
jgi:tetratricopeptide (TPR) repeat protein